MANHGYCKNCWWYQMICRDTHKLIDHPMFGKVLVKDIFGRGRCYMANDSEGHPWHEVKSVDHCPDYVNRIRENKRAKQTLEEWIASHE